MRKIEQGMLHVWGQRNGGWNDYEAMRERRRGLMRMLRDWEEKGREEKGFTTELLYFSNQ